LACTGLPAGLQRAQPKHHASNRTSRSQHFTHDSSNPLRECTTTMSMHQFEHADILWKVRPPPDTSLWKKLWLRFTASLIRLDCLIFSKDPPVVLCPKGGQALLEAYCYSSDSESNNHPPTKVQVGRFLFTTARGPSPQPIQETVQDLYGKTEVTVDVGAIICMLVDPYYRKRNIGALALEVISLIQAIQGIDFTMLVVDDNGSGKLVEWYLQQGYSKAPKLQDLLGSPNAEHGITMIAPTNLRLLPDCQIQWW
jgi:hypothetical protein